MIPQDLNRKRALLPVQMRLSGPFRGALPAILDSSGDIYSFGTVLSEVFNRVRPTLDLRGEKSSWDYLIADMMWHRETGQQRLHQCDNVATILNTVRRLGNFHDAREAGSSRSRRSEKLLRLQGEVSVEVTDIVRRISDTPEFQRLRNIAQLGLSSLVYPSATHTRFSHCLGAYHYSRQFVEALGRHPLFSYLFDDKDLFAVEIAALLHDVGHYPYAHYFEELGQLTIDVGHERLTKRLILGELTYKEFLKSDLSGRVFERRDLSYLLEGWQVDSLSQVLSRSTDVERIIKIFTGKGLYHTLRCIIDSPIDCDKLDYLRRDSTATGVPYAAAIDISRFFSALTLDSHIAPFDLALGAKGKAAAESIISARYTLFSEVYWHKTARAAAAMIKDALWSAQENISQEEFDLAAIGFGDRDFLIWLASKMNDKIRAHDLLIGSLCLAGKRRLYKRVKTYSSVWEEHKKKSLHGKFTDELGKRYNDVSNFRQNLIDNLNELGGSVPDWQPLLSHHILVDVPYLKMDQHGDVAIKYPPSVEGRVFYPLHAVSQLSKAVDDSFAAHVKKVRIFCHPLFVNQIDRLGNDEGESGLDRAIDLAWRDFSKKF